MFEEDRVIVRRLRRRIACGDGLQPTRLIGLPDGEVRKVVFGAQTSTVPVAARAVSSKKSASVCSSARARSIIVSSAARFVCGVLVSVVSMPALLEQEIHQRTSYDVRHPLKITPYFAARSCSHSLRSSPMATIS